MLLKIEVQTLENGREKRNSFEVESTSTVQAVVDILKENDFKNVESISVDMISDAVN